MGDLFGHPEAIPCLSLWQPWASLMMAGLKRHETRHWPTNVRGRVAIHAAKTLDRDGAPAELCEYAFGRDWARLLPRGAVLGVGELTACLRSENLAGQIEWSDDESGNFSEGRFGFRFDNIRELDNPIPTLGRQGFFRWAPPADLNVRLVPTRPHERAARDWADFAAVALGRER